MDIYEEDCYPRGGSKPSLNKTDSHSHLHSDKQENLFGLNDKRKAKKRQRKNSQGLQSKQPRDGDASYRLNSAEVLTFKTIQEGTLVLGCVKEISSLALTIELPGLLFCTLQVNYISEVFTRQLSERLESDAIDEDKELHILNSVFKRGQFIPTRVMHIEFIGMKTKVFLSTKPSDVNANYYHADFRGGTLIWAAVVEKSDHGYILDVGVKHVRIILPFKHVEVGKEYVIGEPLWCVVKSATSSTQVTTLIVSALQGDVDASVQTEVSHVEKVMPGMRVKFRAEKSLKDGLEGTIFTDSVAYVNEVHLSEPFASKESYVGETLPALVLYVQPTTKFTFLTLRTTRMGRQPNLSVGQILPAQVISRIDKGIFLKLTKKDRGFITQGRIRNSISLTDFSDLEALTEAKYPRGSTHTCRILDHTLMDNLYVCTFEKQVLDEKLFTVSDVKVGEVVKGTVQEINQSGIAIKMGNLKGFVTNEHLSNARYSEVFKTKFKKGQTVTGRVWLNKSPSSIKLTLKSAFLESDVCLKDYGEAQVNSQYPGMVVKITASGALIKFYNDVQGWLKQTPNSQQQHSFKQLLYEGQVVSVWVVKKEGTRLTLSLEEDPSTRREIAAPEVQAQGVIEAKPQRLRPVKVGQFVTARVTKIKSDGIYVSVMGASKPVGFIPVNHLSCDPSLGAVLLWFYQTGNEINDLICISDRKRTILSTTEARYFTQEKYEIPKRWKKNSIIRCYFGKAKKTLLSLTCPIRQNDKDVIVNRQSFGPLKNYQPIMVKVSELKNKKHYAIGSANLEDVYNLDFDYAARRLGRYLDDVALIQRRSVERNDLLGCFTPGERILCTVVSFDQKECAVTLRDGVKGVVARRNCPENLKLHQTHTGVVLWTDFVNKHVEVALKPKIANKINATQDGVVRASPDGLIRCEVLSLHENFVLCLLENGQLAYIPTQLHENDFSPDCSYYEELRRGFDFKIVLAAKERIIGFESTFKRNLIRSSTNFKNVIKNEVVFEENGIDDSDGGGNESFEDDEIMAEEIDNDVVELVDENSDDYDEISNDVVEFDRDIIEESDGDDFDVPRKAEDDSPVENENYAEVDENSDDYDEISNDVVEFDRDIIEESDGDDFDVPRKAEDDSPVENENYAEVEESREQEESDSDRVDLDVQVEEQVFDDENESDVDDSDVSGEPNQDRKEMSVSMNEEEDLSDMIDSEGDEELMSETDGFPGEAEAEQNAEVVSETKTEEQMHFLVTGGENSDAPDFEQARRAKSKANFTAELSKIKPVKRKKKKEDRTKRELKRVKRIKLLRKSLLKIKDTEELLYNKSYQIDTDDHPVLPGVQGFFESDKEDDDDDVAGTSEDEAELSGIALSKGKNRKLSRRERADLVREQEEYLRGKEEELINSGGVPQNVEQFDRRLLGEPNSSELWAQYIAFHIQSTEIDKARAVAQRALKTIQQSAVQDRLNIWLTYLNLEGMYGTRETFDQVFEEAVRCNDALTIYLEAIKILAESSSADEKIKKAKSKFKQEAKMYIKVGKVYYKQNRLADARKLKDSALRTILDKKKHVPLIVQFAIMEFNSGEENHGEALFETILQSDPRRTDVWGTYVDQLVKKNKIDLARRVLRRAAAQKLNYKKMKVLYKKFQEFEQRYGTSESQAHVKELLQEYASQFADD